MIPSKANFFQPSKVSSPQCSFIIYGNYRHFLFTTLIGQQSVPKSKKLYIVKGMCSKQQKTSLLNTNSPHIA